MYNGGHDGTLAKHLRPTTQVWVFAAPIGAQPAFDGLPIEVVPWASSEPSVCTSEVQHQAEHDSFDVLWLNLGDAGDMQRGGRRDDRERDNHTRQKCRG